MKIRILCTDGSPLGVLHSDIFGKNERIGIGGAELALLTMCEEWGKAGHEVYLYNSPRLAENNGYFVQLDVNSYVPYENSDVDICFRTPNWRIAESEALKVWWSCDQYTSADFASFKDIPNVIVCISPFHQRYFSDVYKINNTVSIDLPVRMNDYFGEEEYKKLYYEKIPYRCIFTSVPDRGLKYLLGIWRFIKDAVPQATLVITSDYRLWGSADARIEHYVSSSFGLQDVIYWGGIRRQQLLETQLQAVCLAYPCVYEELFCYAVAEAETCGVMPITTSFGALETTCFWDSMKINGNPSEDIWKQEFVGRVIHTLLNYDNVQRDSISTEARKRFAPERILRLWDQLVFSKLGE